MQQDAAADHIAIVGLGPSYHAYINAAEAAGGRSALFGEVWAINSFGDVIACDLVFHMDDIANVMREAEDEKIEPHVRMKLANMLKWLRTHPGPIYTSIPHPEFPGMVAFPLAEVINSVGTAYFNNSVAYAVVYAIHRFVTTGRPKQLSLYGCDYAYGKKNYEGIGRACVEWWLGVAAAKGIHVHVANTSTLMDANTPERKFYGYEAVEIDIRPMEEGKSKLTMTPRETPLPSMDREK